MSHEARRALGIVCPAFAQVGVDNLSLPSLRPHDVLVRTAFSGVSNGTDRWVIQGRFTWSPATPPFVPGYQRAGIVEAVGEEVTAVEVGQSVVATRSVDFGNAHCSSGAHASRAVCAEQDTYDATGIDPRRAAFVVVAQVGVNAASRINGDPGDRVLVIGDGVIGASGALAAKARGFDVLVLGRHRRRLAALEQAGVAVVDGSGTSQAVPSAFGPVAVIDTVQNPEAFAVAASLLERGSGQLVYSGHSPDGSTCWADMAELQKREYTVHFVSGWTHARIQTTLGLMRDGRLPMEQLTEDIAQSEGDAVGLMTAVAAGHMAQLASAVDWAWAW